MAGMLPKMTGETWRYPKSEIVMVSAGMHTIAHNVQVRRASIMGRVVNRPIL